MNILIRHCPSAKVSTLVSFLSLDVKIRDEISTLHRYLLRNSLKKDEPHLLTAKWAPNYAPIKVKLYLELEMKGERKQL